MISQKLVLLAGQRRLKRVFQHFARKHPPPIVAVRMLTVVVTRMALVVDVDVAKMTSFYHPAIAGFFIRYRRLYHFEANVKHAQTMSIE